MGGEVQEDDLPDLPNLLGATPPKGHVVIVHGHSAGVGVWAKVVDGLQRSGYAFHLLDMPGWGRSVGPAALETETDPDGIIDMYVGMLEAWREAHGLDKVTVLAHSFGSYLSMFWARRHPSHIDNVILVSPAGIFPVMPATSWRAGLAFKTVTPQRFSKLWGRLGLAMFRAGNVLFSDDLDPDMIDYYYQLAVASKRLPGAGDRAVARFIEYPAWNQSVFNRPAVGVLLGLRQHVTLVFGQNDPIVPASFGALVQQLRPSGLNVFRLSDASHNPAHCRPSAFCEAIQHALWLYEERLEAQRRDARRSSATLHRIIHAPQYSVVPRCTTCGARVRQRSAALECDCGKVMFFATPSRRDTVSRLKVMEDTYRRLFVEQRFSPQAVDARFATVTPRHTGGKRQKKFTFPATGADSDSPNAAADAAPDAATAVLEEQRQWKADSARVDRLPSVQEPVATHNQDAQQHVKVPRMDDKEAAFTSSPSAMESPVSGGGRRRTMSDAMVRLDVAGHEGEHVEM